MSEKEIREIIHSIYLNLTGEGEERAEPIIDYIKSLEKQLKEFQPVIDEMDKQLQKWGEQNHEPAIYNNILMEEVGEVAKAILQTEVPGKGEYSNWEDVKKEIIHVAAVAMSMIRSLERNQL